MGVRAGLLGLRTGPVEPSAVDRRPSVRSTSWRARGRSSTTPARSRSPTAAAPATGPRTRCRRSRARWPRLPLRRDRRARHRRRRAARLPRRPPRPGHRPHRRDRASCRGARCSQARVDGREPIPLLEDLLGTWPDAAGQHRPEARRRGRAAGRRRCAAPAAIDRVCVGVVLRPPRSPGCGALLGPAAVHLARARGPPPGCAAAAVGAPGRPAPGAVRPGAAPLQGRADRRPSASSTPPTTAACRCTSGPSTIPTRCTELLDLGVDGIMTDRPAVLQRRARATGSQLVPRVGSASAPSAGRLEQQHVRVEDARRVEGRLDGPHGGDLGRRCG